MRRPEETPVSRSGWMPRAVRTAAAALIVAVPAAIAPILLPAAPAAADVPPAPVGEFIAPACPGGTTLTPDRTIREPDLGAYNAGEIVAVYDHSGRAPQRDWTPAADTLSFPPLCGVRYLSEASGGPAGGGPVAAWMFCTEVFDHVCNDGQPLGPADPDDVEMTDLERRVFAYAAHNGLPYTDDGGYPMTLPSGTARADGSTAERSALQYLLWCLQSADLVLLDAGYRSFCAANQLAPADLATRFAFLDAGLPPAMSLAPASAAALTGATVEFVLTTTVIESRIAISAAGGTVALCAGETGATLAGGALRVAAPADPSRPAEVRLCVTAAVAGEVRLTVSGYPAAEELLNWYSNGREDCQVYAAFNRVEPNRLDAAAAAEFQDEPTGGFALTKAVLAGARAAADPAAEYHIAYDCGPGHSDVLELSAGATESVAGLPIGAVCTLTEQTPPAPIAGRWESPSWSLPPPAVGTTGSSVAFTITEESGAAPIAVLLTNRLAGLSAFSLLKTVEGGIGPVGAQYAFDYECRDADDAVVGAGRLLLAAGQRSIPVEVAPDAECTIAEATPPAAPEGSRWLDPEYRITGVAALELDGVARFRVPAFAGAVVSVSAVNWIGPVLLLETGIGAGLLLAAAMGALLLAAGALALLLQRRRRQVLTRHGGVAAHARRR